MPGIWSTTIVTGLDALGVTVAIIAPHGMTSAIGRRTTVPHTIERRTTIRHTIGRRKTSRKRRKNDIE
ncbi:hypothetical protein RHMOL_Rhmol04G0340400 [Rhododendron molle]|uniref:Uncharacterized protein n=1 Tax=Rhododendron molle TaxID=49168 RepID=A0ACC0P9K2_RHOML|nr:hypothetical protein RHMOL_Rhmol04G0340400 [Rhododendron molle]